MRRVLAILAAGVVGTFGLAVASQGSTPTLKGEVGPGYEIEVKKGGKDLKTLRHGTYRIVVEDKASIHNFHLVGPGVNKKTGVGFQGKRTWTLKLKKGRYTYQCDPHARGGMKGSFRVT